MRNPEAGPASGPSSGLEMSSSATATDSTGAAIPSERQPEWPHKLWAKQIVGLNKLLPTGDVKLPRQQKSSWSSVRELNKTTHINKQLPVEQQGTITTGSDSVNTLVTNNNGEGINYWHYKQTGIKSRPIKLLKHPIEHIERKIILTYLLGFLFKFIAIITGPVVVLIVFLLTVPSVALRRFTWFILNLSFTFDAGIRTRNEDEKLLDFHGMLTNKSDKQIYWNYCPFNYLETYWYKERLINTVILLIDHSSNNNKQEEFSIDKLQSLVRVNLLSRPSFRKFLSQVVKRGLPFYKSYYWRHLGLANNDNNSNRKQDEKGEEDFNLEFIDNDGSEQKLIEKTAGGPARQLSPSSSSSSVGRFSTSSSSSSSSSTATETAHESVYIAINPQPAAQSPSRDKVHLERHVFLDKTFARSGGASRAAIRKYVYKLIDTKLDRNRPLWEIRLVPAEGVGKSYLIFRCHQSLADGRSLSNILKENLILNNDNPLGHAISNDLANELPVKQDKDHKEEDENLLQPTKEKASFVERLSRANSLRSAILVGPLTVLLWVIWTFTRGNNNHLHKRTNNTAMGSEGAYVCQTKEDQRRFYMTSYSLTKIHQIKQMTRSTVSDVILCALSGALRDYLRKFNGVTNPPNLNISLTVDMSAGEGKNKIECINTGDGSLGTQESAGEAQSQSLGAISETLCSGRIHKSELPRQPGGDDGKEAATAPGVNCTLINVPLPTSVEGTVPRLWELRNTMDELRTSADPWVMVGFQKFLFQLLPVPWYQWLINYVALRNSSTFVSNIRGPQNLVEAWCVDLLQRAIYESQQAPRSIETMDPTLETNFQFSGKQLDQKTAEMKAMRAKRRLVDREKRVKLLDNLGSISEIHYCMQPPSGDIPISFNCITYYNKLFVTSLSRSLLVEDSKLLMRLFFRQLDQLANTIAKRRSLVTIVRAPVPIEISCQPASPPASSNAQSPTAVALQDSMRALNEHDTDEIGTSIELPYFEKAAPSPTQSATVYRHKDDLEANLGGFSGRTNRCKDCEQPVCTCRRRKSLFSFDLHHQRQHNLLSLLIPIHLMVGSRGSAGNNKSSGGQDSGQLSSGTPVDCLCGQQLLEELDEERAEGRESGDRGDASSTGSRTPSDDGGRAHTRPSGPGRASCSKCHRRVTKRSTLSLNDERMQDDRDVSLVESSDAGDAEPSDGGLNLNSKRSRQTTHSSAQLNVPRDDRFSPKVHSKSETDLLPTGRDDGKSAENQRGSKDSWFAKGKLSRFAKSSSSNQHQRSLSSRARGVHSNSQETVFKTKHRNLIEMPASFDSGNKLLNQQQSRRRRESVATSTGVSYNNWSVIVKDKINNDVSLRYQLDSPFLGIRHRRFSAMGNAVVGNQRRASLLPFGLMHNQSLPKLLWDSDGEAHL